MVQEIQREMEQLTQQETQQGQMTVQQSSRKEERKTACGKCCSFLGAFLHLLFIEHRGALIIPLATRNMLADITLRMTIHDEKKAKEFDKLEKKKTMGDIYDDLEGSIFSYMITYPWNNKFKSQDGLIEYNFGGLLPLLTWTCGVWELVFIGGLLCAMWRKGVTDWCSGKYFAFTWKLQQQRLYTMMIKGLMAMSFILFIGFSSFIFCSLGVEEGKHIMGNGIINFMAWLYAVGCLLQKFRPAFRWNDEEFGELEFDRAYSKDTFIYRLLAYFTTNNQFAHKLEGALLRHHRGAPNIEGEATRIYTQEYIEDMGIKSDDSGIVNEVDEGGQAYKKGVKKGYQILSVNDTEFSTERLTQAAKSGGVYQVGFSVLDARPADSMGTQYSLIGDQPQRIATCNTLAHTATKEDVTTILMRPVHDKEHDQLKFGRRAMDLSHYIKTFAGDD